MNQAWCPFCSHPNPYESIRPKICAKCSQDMTVAFASAPTPPSIHVTMAGSTPPPSTSSVPLRRPKPLYGSYEGASEDSDERISEDHYNKGEVKARASQLASLFGGAFNFTVEEGTTIKAGTILAPIQAQALAGGDKKVRKPRVRKSS